MVSPFLLSWILIAAPLTKCNPTEQKSITNLHIHGKSDKPVFCTYLDVLQWSNGFRSCFPDKQMDRWQLENFVDRVLELSIGCMAKMNLRCKVDYGSFLAIMDKVTDQMKDFSEQFTQNIQGRKKLKNLECIKRGLSNDIHATCFKAVFDTNSTENSLQTKNLENGHFCANKSNKFCSERAKRSLNRMVEAILRVKQPTEENLDKDVSTAVQTTSSEAALTTLLPLLSTTVSQSITEETTELPTQQSQAKIKAETVVLSLLALHPTSSSLAKKIAQPESLSLSTLLDETLPPSVLPPANQEEKRHKAPPQPPPLQPSSSSPPQPPPLHPSPSPPPQPPAFKPSPPPPLQPSPSPPTQRPPLPQPLPSPQRTESHHHEHEHEPRTTPPPTSPPLQPWRWYDYIIKPVVSAWNWFKGLFGF